MPLNPAQAIYAPLDGWIGTLFKQQELMAMMMLPSSYDGTISGEHGPPYLVQELEDTSDPLLVPYSY